MDNSDYMTLAEEAYSILLRNGSLHRRVFVDLIKEKFGDSKSYDLKLLKTDEMGSDQICIKLLRIFAKLRGENYKYDPKTQSWIQKY